MAQAQKFSITRCRATWKPRVSDADIPFFRCSTCGLIVQGIEQREAASTREPGRNPLNIPPYSHVTSTPSCCGGPMEEIPCWEAENAPEGFRIDYQIVGGYNENCIRIDWTPSNEGEKPRWIALKTFTGLQLKYVYPSSKKSFLFALAQDDAYVYCDKNPCLECVFMCKRGFIAYAYLESTGVIRVPLERASASRKSTPHLSGEEQG
ncbi:hypothetical protein HLV37_06660 [Eggerthellaceae bacterium zg-1084]|uniref:hypothetical protein n=1 Tax=Berryella wangjianweii TaxID=2734634 RepID=UPI0015557803|nr:hypothetical protein [Berryella wangjianweii]NPD31534.1 hypothetical protein [Berryella wangjianweii]NPD32971.1 hypothetical protein [Eggerthellaceae bacterium zg-997]